MIIGASFIYIGDMNHFTWWTVYIFLLNATMMCLHLGHRTIMVYVTASLVVSVGVLGMSAMKCTMLVDTASEMGLAYLPANAIVHWLLLPITLCYPPKEKPHKYTTQVMFAISLFSMFALFFDATNVYGCDFYRGVLPVTVTILIPVLMINKKLREYVVYYIHDDKSY